MRLHQTRYAPPLLLALLLGSLMSPVSRAANWKENRDRLREEIENKVKLEVGRQLNPPKIAEHLGLHYPPPAPSRSVDEVKKAAVEAAQNKVDEQFPPEQIEQFRNEAEEKYALWEEGDEVSFVIRGGRGRTPAVAGRLRHVSSTRVKIDNRWIAHQDITREALARLDPDIHKSVVEKTVRKQQITRAVERERLYDKVYPAINKRLMKDSHYVQWKGRWIAADELFEKALVYHRRKLAKKIHPDIEHEVFTENDYVQREGEWVPKGMLGRLKKALSGESDSTDPEQDVQTEQEAPDESPAPVEPVKQPASDFPPEVKQPQNP